MKPAITTTPYLKAPAIRFADGVVVEGDVEIKNAAAFLCSLRGNGMNLKTAR